MSSQPGGRQRKRQAAPQISKLNRLERVQLALGCNQKLISSSDHFSQQIAGISNSPMAEQRELQNFIADIHSIVEGNSIYLDAVNISTAFQQLDAAVTTVPPAVTTLPAAQDLLAQLTSLAINCLPDFKIASVNLTVCSLAKMEALGQSSPLPFHGTAEHADLQYLLEGLAERAYLRFLEPPPPDPKFLALLMWAYSRLGVNPLEGKLFQVVERAATPLLSQFSHQNLSNLLLAAANLEQPLEPDFLRAAAQEAILKMPQASSQAVCNLLYAFAKLLPPSPIKADLFRGGVARAIEDIQAWSVLNIAILLRAVVTVRHPINRSSLEILGNKAFKDIQSATPTSIANLLSCCAKLDINPQNGRLVIAAIEQADRCLKSCDRQALANILWALGSLQPTLPGRLLQRLDSTWAELAVQKLKGGEDDHWAQHCSNILWAFSRLHLDPLNGRFFEEAFAQMEERMELLDSQHFSKVLLAAAALQRRSYSPNFLSNALKSIAISGNRLEVCNTFWSMTASGFMKPAVADSLAARLQTLGATEMSIEEARQILMANMVLKGAHRDHGRHGLPSSLIATAELCLKQNPAPPIISQFHEDVSSTLKAMRIPHAIEVTSPDRLLSIDIVARCGDGSPLAIEVDGDSHFTALQPFRPLGNTVLRNQLIAASGFKGVGVPFYDWRLLDSDSKRQTYLAARLAKFGVVQQASSE